MTRRRYLLFLWERILRDTRLRKRPADRTLLGKSHVIPLKSAPSRGKDLDLSNTWFLEPHPDRLTKMFSRSTWLIGVSNTQTDRPTDHDTMHLWQ